MRVLVTGGTGSLGHALVPALLEQGHAVRVLSRDERKQLDGRQRWPEVEWVLGDVRNPGSLWDAVSGCGWVIHASSLKFVDVGEIQPREYIQTNAVGTLLLVDACLQVGGVQRVVGISSDKAAGGAINTYGATKLLLEKLFWEAAVMRRREGTPEFIVARYGNVAGTRGSVIPRWAEARAKGQALAVTDPAMTRFFFALDEAVDLVRYALETAPNGSIVGKRLRACAVGDLARVMAGDPAAGGVPVTVAGRRLGEKLHETLFTADELGRTEVDGDVLVMDPLVRRDSVPAPAGYTSDAAPRLSDGELRRLLHAWITGPASRGEVSDAARAALRDAWGAF